ncbi:MAG: PilZ domain-containing protein [Proteobacteria bacterium]|nr:PilZ domain-containing protein [Pseudomonadota bacterium]MBU1716566.1 PilZ domain-containing protein [Pseudomonadota bacterium]
MVEQRERLRIAYKTKVMLCTESKEIFLAASTRDISITGMFARTEVTFPIGTQCYVEIILAGKNTEMVMRINGKVVRREAEGCAIEFENDLEWWPVFKMYLQYGK